MVLLMKKLVILMSPKGKTKDQFIKEVRMQLEKKKLLEEKSEVVFVPKFEPVNKSKRLKK